MNKQQARELALYRYHTALDRGDFATAAAVLAQAVRDPVLEQMVLDLHDVLQAEPDPRHAYPVIKPAASSNGHAAGHLFTEDIPMTTYTIPQQRLRLALPRGWRLSAPLIAALIVVALLAVVLALKDGGSGSFAGPGEPDGGLPGAGWQVRTATATPSPINPAVVTATASPINPAFVTVTPSPIGPAVVTATPSPINPAFVTVTPSPIGPAVVTATASPIGPAFVTVTPSPIGPVTLPPYTTLEAQTYYLQPTFSPPYPAMGGYAPESYVPALRPNETIYGAVPAADEIAFYRYTAEEAGRVSLMVVSPSFQPQLLVFHLGHPEDVQPAEAEGTLATVTVDLEAGDRLLIFVFSADGERTGEFLFNLTVAE